MSIPFSQNVSSLAEVIAESTGKLTLVPGSYVRSWLPDLAAPHGWTSAVADDPGMTRVLTRHTDSGHTWDGCEVLNVYRVSGTVPEDLVLRNAERALRDCAATGIHTYRMVTPPRYGLVATRSSGTLNTDPRAIRADFNYYAFNTDAGGALVEQVLAVGVDAHAALAREVAELTENLYRSLATRIDRALASSV